MGITEILAMIGGLALFLLGMNSMGEGLEKACGSKMKTILEKLTSNRFLGLIVGAVITMVIQSSSATTVMVVGFVNAGMMTLTQAVWIIMGANVGTTITGQLVALDVGAIAPIFAVIGVVIILFIKNRPTLTEIGKILAGFGILFIGMDTMSAAMKGLRDSEVFVNIVSNFEFPLVGILAGAIFTALIQSSSAAIGILQALSTGGAVGLEQAVFVLFGMNIGTCITALLSSASANRNAKRATLIHSMFNVIGTMIFTLFVVVSPFVEWMQALADKPAAQIANTHTIFNIATTLILLPFGGLLVKLAEKIIPERKVKQESIFMYLTGTEPSMRVGGNAVHMENIRLEINRMYKLAYENIEISFNMLETSDYSNANKLRETEDLIDKLNEGITKEITESISHESNMGDSEKYSAYLNMSHDIERLSDHALNIVEYAEELKAKEIVLNPEVLVEIAQMKEVLHNMYELSLDKKNYERVSELEDVTDNLTVEFKSNMVERLKSSTCKAEGSVIYSNLLINFERIGDHLLNVAQSARLIK